ncbi:ABC transporter permease [Levilactobacillus tangyuanensis]|uniref:ABC transporter permease n=1 Tax=Levilactobacillus tangyuanensis TaxID=2486021 RepID=A0ABW1TP80_9LACO|nr:ABC transporter permease subunit [Levilactobacillus tangyuanensis]
MRTRLKVFFPLSILVVLVLLLPILIMVIASFQSTDGSFSLANYQQVITNHYYLKAIRNSLGISVVASAVSLIIAVIGAWALTRLSQKTKNILITLFNMSASFAGVPLAFSLIILFGNAGVWKAMTAAMHLKDSLEIYSLTGTTLAFTFFEIPLGIMFLFPVFEELNPEWREISAVLGAKPLFFFKKVILPVILPNMIEVFTLLFANAMGTYETIYALTGNSIVTIPILIGTLIDGGLTANIPLACTFATLFALVMTFIVWVGNRVTRSKREAA